MTNKEIKIIAGSTSEHKLNAITETFREVYPNVQIIVNGVKTASEVNEQPVGFEEIFQGACNRLEETKRLVQEAYDFAVGIENGVFSVETGKRAIWFDVGLVIIEDKDGRQGYGLSSGIEFPQKYVDKAKEAGFETTTVGEIIAKEMGGDKTDPQSILSQGLVSRREMLKQALKIALGQLQKDKVRID